MPFETKYVCDVCQPVYVFYKITEHDPRKVKARTPSCPKCKERKAQARLHMKLSGAVQTTETAQETTNKRENNLEDMIKTNAAPSAVGNSFTKALDKTASMVMEDYKMSNLNMDSSLRPGDNCVSKLAPELERKVDQVFDPKLKNNVNGMVGDTLSKSLFNQIEAGAFRNYGDPVARQQSDPHLKPQINIIDHYDNRQK